MMPSAASPLQSGRPLCLKAPLIRSGDARVRRSVAQLVEHRSPKPGVAGSSPATPASEESASANPAVTLARGFTTTFAGIALNHVPGFVLAQLAGAAVAALVAIPLFGNAD